MPRPPHRHFQDWSSIRVTLVVEEVSFYSFIEDQLFTLSQQTYQPIDVTKSWVLGRVPVDQIGPHDWERIKLVKWIFVGGKSYDGKFYRVAVHEDFLPCL